MLMDLFLMTIDAGDSRSSPPTPTEQALPHSPEARSPNSQKTLTEVSSESSEEEEEEEPPPQNQEFKKICANLEDCTQRFSQILAKENLNIEELITLQKIIKNQSETNSKLYVTYFFELTLRDALLQYQQQLKTFSEQVQKRIEPTEQKLLKNIQQTITEVLKKSEENNIDIKELNNMQLIILETRNIVAFLIRETRKNYSSLNQKLGELSNTIELKAHARKVALKNKNETKNEAQKEPGRKRHSELTGEDQNDEPCCCCF